MRMDLERDCRCLRPNVPLRRGWDPRRVDSPPWLPMAASRGPAARAGARTQLCGFDIEDGGEGGKIAKAKTGKAVASLVGAPGPRRCTHVIGRQSREAFTSDAAQCRLSAGARAGFSAA